MTKELHKRLEEAALKISCVCPSNGQFGTGNYEPAEFDEDMYKAAIAGAEHGYKEAITLAKDWLKENTFTATSGQICYRHYSNQKDFLADFEADMNKLWEE